MRLIYEDDKLVTVKNNNNNTQFTMADQNLFIGMYRDTIYKNKLRVIPQEYMANARDAHREIGKEDVPIEVYLPNAIDQMLIIKDYGPGINEERSVIFSQYGASTKRNSDNENGGFGIGCKCAWSYTESFTVDTVYETDCGKKYNRIYSIYITHQLDPGNLRLVSEEEVSSDIPTGTKVCIPIMHNDIDSIKRSVFTVGLFWKVRPIIYNCGDHEYPSFKEIYSGNKWKCFNDVSGLLYGEISKSFVVIDGICYKIDYNLLLEGKSQYEDVGDEIREVSYRLDKYLISVLKRMRIVLFLDINEVVVAPDRENLDYNIRTIKKLSVEFSRAVEELTCQLRQEISNHDNFIAIVKTLSGLDYVAPVRISWTDPVSKYEFVDVISIAKDVQFYSCSVVGKDGYFKKNGDIPIHDIDITKTAFIQYSTKSAAVNAATKLHEYCEETLESMGVDHVIMFHGRERFLNPITTHRRIKTVRRSSKNSATLDGVFYPNGERVRNISDIKPDSKFIIRRHNRSFIWYGSNSSITTMEVNEFIIDRLFDCDIYTVSTIGERCLKKAGIKLDLVDDYIESAIRDKYAKDKSLFYNCIYVDYNTENFIKNYKDYLIEWAERTGNRSAKIVVNLVSKFINDGVSLYYNHNNKKLYDTIKSISKRLGIGDLGLDEKYSDIIQRTLDKIPFINIDIDGPDSKKILRNIILTYKEISHD